MKRRSSRVYSDSVDNIDSDELANKEQLATALSKLISDSTSTSRTLLTSLGVPDKPKQENPPVQGRRRRGVILEDPLIESSHTLTQ